MFNLKQKKFISYLSGLILLELIFIYLNPVKSENKHNNLNSLGNNDLKINNFKNVYPHNFEVNSSMPFDLKKQLNEDINHYGSNLKDLITFEKDPDIKEPNIRATDIEIESDIQYQKDNIYYAEGDVIIYFSNSSLKGDKLIYDRIKKTLTINGNVIFAKGNQYFEATKVFYNLKLNEGFIDNIYGIINAKSFSNDFELKDVETINKVQYYDGVDNLKYKNSANVGIVNNFEGRKIFNIAKFDFDIPSITKWRYKSEKIILKNKVIQSKKILFTNDPINEPQLILKSKDFTAEIVNQKIKLVSAKSWIILDNKLTIPIGKRTIFDEESSSTWGIGSDFKEKDGFYISKDFKNIKINDNFKFNYRPYFLFQRALQGSTKAFRDSDKSILSEKVIDDIDISDIFALDTEVQGNLYSWYLNWQSKLNSLNPDRLSQAFRTKLYLQKSFDLNNKNNLNTDYYEPQGKNFLFDSLVKDKGLNDAYFSDKSVNNIKQLDENNKKEIYKNFLDIKISSAYREKIFRGYSGESEIYFGNSINLTNRKLWSKDDNYKNMNLIYDFGKFKAETKNKEIFDNLYRNVFAIQLGNTYSLFKVKSEDKNINYKYKYSPSIIYPGVSWNNYIESGIFTYSNGESQQAISLSSGPSITLGNFKRDFLDFSKINVRGIYVLKNGESPFKFDDINKNFRMNLELKQQLLGPLVFSYGTSYDFEENKFDLPKYGLDINRRSYSIGAFYNSQNQSAGLNFSIFNFEYTGNSRKF